jgi:hypothetical protein
MRWHLIISAALVVGIAPALALAGPATKNTYKAYLTGSRVVPKPGPASGKGTARFTVSGQRLCWKITTSGIDTPLAAHIHTGGPFTNGPVLVALGKHYQPAGCITISAEAALTIGGCRCGGVYVDVHTRKFPKGASRGTLEVGR